MAHQRRIYRVAEQVRSIIASELLFLGDERLRSITVTSVVVSKDLRHAKVYWSVAGGRTQVGSGEQALQSVSGQLRRKLAESLNIRFVPALAFFYDETLDTAEEVSRLLERVKNKSDS